MQQAAEHTVVQFLPGGLLGYNCIVRQKCERHSALVTDHLLMAGENQFHAVP
jgi:hypothetical protein